MSGIPNEARVRTLDVLIGALGAEEAHALSNDLGLELRAGVEAELRQEFEDDLVKVRTRTFDFGVRTVVHYLQSAGTLTPEQGDEIADRLAVAGFDVEQLRPSFELALGRHVWPDETHGLIDELLDVVQKAIP